MPDLLEILPFARHCGIRLLESEPKRVIGNVDWTPDGCTSGGVMHGGLLMTLADTVGAVCAFLNLPEGSATATIESKTNFCRPVTSGTVIAEALALHVGRTTILLETRIRDDKDKLVSVTTQTQAVIPAPAR